MHLDLACVKLTDTEEELWATKEQCMKLEQRMNALENRGRPYYTWKIGGFQKILTQAKIGNNVYIECDPFYIGEYGYKFKMLLYPNGVREGQNTHLSVFVTNIEGEHDAILQWPCPKEITLTLIDQQANLTNRQSCSMTGRCHWISRPVKGKETSVGFLKFVSHDKLQERAYIVDDTIFVEAKF